MVDAVASLAPLAAPSTDPVGGRADARATKDDGAFAAALETASNDDEPAQVAKQPSSKSGRTASVEVKNGAASKPADTAPGDAEAPVSTPEESLASSAPEAPQAKAEPAEATETAPGLTKAAADETTAQQVATPTLVVVTPAALTNPTPQPAAIETTPTPNATAAPVPAPHVAAQVALPAEGTLPALKTDAGAEKAADGLESADAKPAEATFADAIQPDAPQLAPLRSRDAPKSNAATSLTAGPAPAAFIPVDGARTADSENAAPAAASTPLAPVTAPPPAARAARDVVAQVQPDASPALAQAAPAEVRPQTTAPATLTPTALSVISHTALEATAQIAAQIVRKLEGRSTRFEMALTPEDLGRVDVSLDIDADGRVAARLAFDNPIAAADLRGKVDDLRRQLQDAGFTVADDALTFTDRDPSAGQNGGAFDRQSNPGARRAFGAAGRLSAEADIAIAPRWIPLTLTPERVDMKV